MTINEQGWQDLARASSATARIIEAHSNEDDRICRVVVEMGEHFQDLQLREAVLQLWMEDGFIASASRDGAFLMIDGLRGQASNEMLDLINVVAEQIKRYTQRSMQRDAAGEMTGSCEQMAFLAKALEEQASARQ